MRRSIGWLFSATLLASVMLASIFIALRSVSARSAFATPTASLIWPISGSTAPDINSISSPFGPRWQASQTRYDYHPGLDIAAPISTPVHAVAAGVVTYVGFPSGDAGLSVFISHTLLGFYSTYLHLNSTEMQVGQPVTQGQIIGFVGNTGTTEFYHLHFEIRLTASNYPTSTRNPLGYLPRSDVATPALQIVQLISDPIYSPTVSLLITVPRSELDLNQVRVQLVDRATGSLLDDQGVDFNLREHAGSDTLNQDGIQLIPSHFTTTTQDYQLTANFNALRGYDAFTLTAQAIDLNGHVSAITATANDTTPPAKITLLNAARRPDGGVNVTWIAPGDSGFVGQAMTYELRYASVPIDGFNWDTATPVTNPSAPVSAYQWQTWSSIGALPDPVCFAVKAADVEGNWSPRSDSICARWIVRLPLIVKQ